MKVTDLRETSVNFVAGEPYASVFSSDPKWIRRIRALIEQFPDETDIYAENPDGSILAHIPPEYVFKFKGKRKMSEEQRAECIARLSAAKKAQLEELRKAKMAAATDRKDE